MRISGYRIITLIVFISLFYTACHIVNTNETDYHGKFGDFEWYVDKKGEVRISRYTGAGGDVTVPPKIEGKPVIYIGGYAFRHCDKLESVILPNSITAI